MPLPTKPPTSRPPIQRPPSTATTRPQGAAAGIATRATKVFSIVNHNDAKWGEKIVVYSKLGMGKTTLASMAPGAIFLPIDDGDRKIVNPLTGELVNKVDKLQSFYDVRDALHQSNLWPDGCTIVIDNLTKLEAVEEEWVFDNYKTKTGRAANMRAYGWDGPAHMLDAARLLLSDLDAHVRAGRNVVLLAQLGQATVANSEGVDFLEDGPRLTHNKQYSVRSEVCEWADHVVKIGYLNSQVEKDDEKRSVGKISGDATHAIFTGGAMHFIAKSRPMPAGRIPEIVTFTSPADNSFWQLLFPESFTEETTK